jgi:DNA-directed RNA polymerase II subunit RPB2
VEINLILNGIYLFKFVKFKQTNYTKGIEGGMERLSSLSDLAPAVFRSYFKNSPTFLTNHHMHSYESFIMNELPTYIKSQNPIRLITDPFDHPKTGEKTYKYEVELYVGGEDGSAIYISPPTFQQGTTVRRLFPNDARLWNINYSVNFSFDILVRYTLRTINTEDDTVNVAVSDVVFSKHQLFAIPILLKSRFCSTHGASSTLLTEMGECKHEQGGYFIINGKEKVLITRQEQAFNAIIITKKPAHDTKLKVITSVNCQHPVTRLTRNITMYIMKGDGDTKHLDNVIRISIPQVNGAIPVFILFRALGVDTDEEIVNMIVPDSSNVEGTSIKNFLHESIMDAYPVINQSLAIEFIRTLTKGFIIENVLNQPHVIIYLLGYVSGILTICLYLWFFKKPEYSKQLNRLEERKLL